MAKVRNEYGGHLALLDAVYFNGILIGHISDEGIEFGGEDAQTFELWAAQIRTSPVDELETRAATNEVTGKMIELVPKNLVTLAGGTANGERWDAPATSIMKEGSLKVLTGTGGTIEMKRAKLRLTQLRGGLGGENTVGINFGFKMLTPLDGTSPYSIYPTEAFISANPDTLTFDAAGGEKGIDIEASGPFSVGNVPAGFSVELVNGRVTIVASENSTSSTRSGSIDFILESDGETSVSVSVSQSA